MSENNKKNNKPKPNPANNYKPPPLKPDYKRNSEGVLHKTPPKKEQK